MSWRTGLYNCASRVIRPYGLTLPKVEGVLKLWISRRYLFCSKALNTPPSLALMAWNLHLYEIRGAKKTPPILIMCFKIYPCL